MLYVLLYLLLSIATAFTFGQFFARRDAEARAAILQLQLQDAIDVQLDQYDELEQLRPALAAAVYERNAANLRAQRAINSLRALPEINLHCPLPADQVHTTTFNLN
jgi:hypothetical protein